MSQAKTITLNAHSIVVHLTGDGGGAISSTLKVAEVDSENALDDRMYNAAIDGIESMVLAHAVAGVDIQSPGYQEGIQAAVDAVGNQV